MKINYIRHGESEANIKQCFAGQTQSKLTEQGILQAINLNKILNQLTFDKIYCSDLIRAMDTQKYALPGYSSETLPLLREIDVGKLAGHLVTDCPGIFGDSFQDNLKYNNFTPYGGECKKDLYDRVNNFLDIALSSGNENIAVFTHGGFIKALAETVLNLDINNTLISPKNCSVTVLEYKNAAWHLEIYNYTNILE